MIGEIGSHALAHGPRVKQVKRQEAPLVFEIGDAADRRIGAAGLEELAALAVDEHCLRPLLRNGLHHQHVGLRQVAHRGHKGSFIAPLFVPDTLQRAQFGANVHLVHGGVEAHP